MRTASRDGDDRRCVRCPFEGAVRSGRVIELASRLTDAGADEIVLQYTVGFGGRGM